MRADQMRDLLALIGPEKFAAAIEIITRRSANAVRCERYKKNQSMSGHACPDTLSGKSAVIVSFNKKDIKEKKITAPQSRGTRIPDEWVPSPETIQWAWDEYQ